MKSKKIWIVAFIILIAAGVGFYLKRGSHEDIKYREYTVIRGNLSETILSTGTVYPENRLEIKPPVAGRVENVLVREGDKIRKGQILAWMSSTERAALIDAASSKGPEEIASWEEMYRKTPIRAPINGALIARNIESGQTFTANDAILVMSDRLTVKAQVDETDIARVQLKQKATIVLDAYGAEKIEATVDQIAFEAKTVNNVTTYLVNVLPVQAPSYMRSGMTANVTFQVTEKENVLFVPADSIKVSNGNSFVIVKTTKGKIEKEISTGLSDRKRIEVTSGLIGDEVLLIPEFKLEGKKSGGSPFSPSGPKRRGK